MREGTKASNTTTIARKILHTWTRRTGCWIRVVVHDGSEIKLLYVYGIHICSETKSMGTENWGAGTELSPRSTGSRIGSAPTSSTIGAGQTATSALLFEIRCRTGRGSSRAELR